MPPPSTAPVLVALPAWNEEACIGETLLELQRAGLVVDVLVVDDGSEDGTAQAARRAGAQIIRHPLNLGVAAAESTALRWAVRRGYRRLVRMDADGQHDPSFIPALLAAVDGGEDLVIGSRFIDGSRAGFGSTPWRRAGSTFLAKLLTGLSGVRITDPTSGFRAFGPAAMSLFASAFPHDYPEPESVLMASRRGLSVREVPVRMRPRRAGTSSITPGESVVYMGKVSLALVIERMRGPG